MRTPRNDKWYYYQVRLGFIFNDRLQRKRRLANLSTMAVTLNQLRAIARDLPGIEERLCHGTPAFYVRAKILARLQEDGEHWCVAFPKWEREALIDQHPEVFSVTNHIANYDYVLMNLIAASPALARARLDGAWRMKAAKRAVADFDRKAGTED